MSFPTVRAAHSGEAPSYAVLPRDWQPGPRGFRAATAGERLVSRSQRRRERDVDLELIVAGVLHRLTAAAHEVDRVVGVGGEVPVRPALERRVLLRLLVEDGDPQQLRAGGLGVQRVGAGEGLDDLSQVV